MGSHPAAALARVGSASTLMRRAFTSRAKPATMAMLAVLLIGFQLAFWLWLQSPLGVLLPGDEPLYLLDAQRWLAGAGLYTDIFLAHLPARIWQAALPMALGAPVFWGKLWAPLATLVTAALLARLTWRSHGPGAALAAVALFLFSPRVLQDGAALVGVEQALLLATLATVLVLAQRAGLAGLVVALAAQWALHVAVLLPLLLFWTWRDRTLRRFLIGLAIGTVPLVAACLVYGAPLLAQVVAYHAQKVQHISGHTGPDRVLPFLAEQAPLLLLALAAALRGGSLARRLACSGWTALALVLLWPRLQSYYFLLPLPWLVAAAAMGLSESPRALRRCAMGLAVVVAVAWALPTALPRREGRVAAEREMQALAAQVLALAPAGPIWGDGALVPLLALRTRLAVAGGDTDVNAQRFLSGQTPPARHIAAVLAERPLVVWVPRHGVATVPQIASAVAERCDPLAPFSAPAAKFSGVLLRCR